MFRRVLVCSAWPYGSDVPHLGNLMSSLLSGDVFSRYYRMRGYDVLYVSGTDSHGTRVAFEAMKRGVSPRYLVEKVHNQIKNIIQAFNIEFDSYTWTESDTHKKFVHEIYLKMYENGYISSHTEKRPYCNNCKIMLADRFIVGTCPHCGYEFAKGNQCDKCGTLLEPDQLINPHCEICGGTNITYKETTHWFLDLDKLKPEIEKYILSRKDWPANVKNMSMNMLKNLRPRAVTRDLEWGIPAPFPGAEGKVIYVWAEAALGYISATMECTPDWREYWFGDDVLQIYTQGKDNIPFHTIIFPAQLIASGENYHLPDRIFATEYLNWENGEAFSKSRSIGLFCDRALQILPAPYWRFYLMYDRPESKDTSFSWTELDKIINQVLIGSMLNYINRVLSFVNQFFNSIIPSGTVDGFVYDKIRESLNEYDSCFEKGSLAKAIKAIESLTHFANRYFQEKEPWKTKDKDVVFNSVYMAKAISIMLYPFIPSVVEEITKVYNFSVKHDEVLEPPKPVKIDKAKPILTKISVVELKKKVKEMYATIDDLEKLGLRVGEIKAASDIPKSDKLYKLTVDVGDRLITLVAGVKDQYTVNDLIGKKIIVATNLKPAKIKGVLSEGMLLAAVGDGVSILVPDRDVKPGCKIE